MIRRVSTLILTLALTSFIALADSNEQYSRIARISYLDGHVSFQHPNEVDWSAASVNFALQPQDRVYTGDDGRAEIEFDDGSVLHLAEKTDVEILSLQEERIQLRILLGLCSLTVKSGVGFEINTPAAAFETQKKGVYRFDVAEDGASDAIVRKGRLEAANNKISKRIDSGELIHVTPGDQGVDQVSRYENRDPWDEWTDRRNADRTADASRRYLPDDVYMGVSELDRYGRWVVVDSYGPAWVPLYVDAGWSPYWVGRWCYRPFWGWTWVSYEPWGWLPYHYGRWHHSSFGWCWLPGASFGFHFWSPALVRFYHGSSWVSWCPLGPGDYYNVNHFYYNRAYNHQLNNIRLIQNRDPHDLVNRSVPGAFRTVATQDFVNSTLGGRGRNNLLENVDQPWQRGRMVSDRLGIQPTATSYVPAPDRSAVRPTMERRLPAVVRSMPSVDGSTSGRFIRITGAPASEGRNAPVDRETAGRSMIVGGRETSNGPGTGEVERGSSSGVTSGSGIRNRSSDRIDPQSPAAGRIYQTPQSPGSRDNAPRIYGREMPGSSGSRGETPARGRDSSPPIPSVIGRPRAGDREAPRPSSPRTEPAPTRRMEGSPAPPPAARPDVERPRPQERSRPPIAESYGYESRSSWTQIGSGTESAIPRTPSGGRIYEPPASPPTWGSARNVYGIPAAPPGSWSGGRGVYSAPAAPSRSWGGVPGSSVGSASPGMRTAPAPSAPSGGAGSGRQRGR